MANKPAAGSLGVGNQGIEGGYGGDRGVSLGILGLQIPPRAPAEDVGGHERHELSATQYVA